MKKFKRIAYIVLIVIVAVLSLTIYTNASKDNGENQKEKVLSEIKYVERKMITLFNAMNNVKLDNYNIVTTEESTNSINSSGKADDSNSDKSSSSQSGGSGEENPSSSSGEEQEGSDSKSSSSQESSQSGSGSGEENNSREQQKTFELQKNEILTGSNQEINWDVVKSEVENLYDDLPSITMDMYQLDNINQEDILNFSKEYDNLSTAVQNENKKEFLLQLTKIYEYIPKFLKSSEQNELYTISVEAKSNIFKGYAKLDDEKWDEISNDIKAATDVYGGLLTNTSIEQTKQSNISKAYIMINELQNAIKLKDKSIFLIKYRNLLEEINNM